MSSTSKKRDFVHLHCHTDYSMLDGAAPVDKMVEEVLRLGQSAVAITDHGVLHGTYDLWKACKKTEGKVKAIVGVEAYVTPGTSRRDDQPQFFAGPYGVSEEDKVRRRDDVSASGWYTHMTLWAGDNEGMKNLNWMQSIASKDRPKNKHDRIDRELMEQYSKGLLATSGCPSGAVQTYLRLGMYKEAIREAGELQDIFGKENFYIELMDHQMDLERRCRQDLLKIAKELDAPLVATNDSHFVGPDDRVAQDALLSINSGNLLTDPDRFKFDGDGYFLRSTEQMWELFADIPEALTNTLVIAERCNVEFEPEQGRYMPHVPVPETTDEAAKANVREKIAVYNQKIDEREAGLPAEKKTKHFSVTDAVVDEGVLFINEVYRGLNLRFPEGIPEEHRKQAEYEIETILGMGFPSYFLVVADFVQWAKNNDIYVGPGRGSAAGSLVSYAMMITDLDPLQYKLLFERFLNPERISLPDIDIDFEEGGREKVIEYCAQKYGNDNVAQIITFGKMLAKGALRDAARIMGYDYNSGDLLTKKYPMPIMGKAPTLPQIFDTQHDRYKEGDEFRDLLKTGKGVVTYITKTADGKKIENTQEGNYQEIFDLASQIEGLIRNWGVHASGVLVSSSPIPDVCPILRRGTDGAIITQFEAHGCEDLGLVKMDFLGLKNLNTLKECLRNIERTTGAPLDIDKIPMDDPATFELIGNGDTLGVFQLDGDGMQSLMKRMKPTEFNDISAAIALYRPGPMGMNSHNKFADRKNGREPIEPIHPEVDKPLEEFLGDTYGVVVFQEQIQQAAVALAGYTLGQADILRRAMGKKIKAELDAQYSTFSGGMKANGYSDAAVKSVWDVFEPFADYAFNRAHTAAYGLNAYRNAYLKANYPVPYMAALLTTFENNKDKTALYLGECRRMDIQVEVPSVNRSIVEFNPNGEKILFGLGAVRNVGEGMAEEIIKAREEKGAFISFQDFLEKVPEAVLNKRKIESLIKAGAFDEFGDSRKALMLVHIDAIDAVLPVKRKEAVGQFDLFSSLGLEDDNVSDAFNNTVKVQVPKIEEWDKRTKLDFEKEMLGLYVSDHPLASIAGALGRNSDMSIIGLRDQERLKSLQASGDTRRGATVKLSGMIATKNVRVAKSGNQYAIITLEDLTGSVELAMFGKTFEEWGNAAQIDQVVMVEARVRVDESGDDELTANLSVGKIEPLNISLDSADKVITLEMAGSVCTPERLAKFKEILANYPGQTKVNIGIIGDKKTTTLELPDDLRVKESSAFYSEVKALFGLVRIV